MKHTKFNKKILLFIFIIIIIFILYLLYTYIFSKLNSKDNFLVPVVVPTTTYNFKKTNTETIDKQKAAEAAPNTTMPAEDSGKCGPDNNVIDYCINFKSCCGNPTEDNKCICSMPFVQKCRTAFQECLNNNPNALSSAELMTKCIESNKTCCSEYSKMESDSSKFSDPIKNEPSIVPICGIKNGQNMPQKCLELCENTPACKSYAINLGKVVQSAGYCNLFDQVSINKPEVDLKTGKPKNNVEADYYTKN